MQDFGTKADDTAGPSGQLSAAEFNNLAGENENAVLRSGQALVGGSETQLATSLFIHSVKSESFQDNGTPNVYVATPTSGASGVSLPSNYDALNGAVISFIPASTNTTASTLNIGQTTGTLLGAKPILAQGGSSLPPSAVPANSIISGHLVSLRYDASLNAGSGAWVILPWAESRFLQNGVAVFNASGTWNVPGGVSRALVTVIGGGGGGGRNPVAGGGGGGGGVAIELVSLIGVTSVSVTVGAGGAGAASGTTALDGSPGGTSSFGAFCSATGGVGGGGGGSGGGGGVGSGGDINTSLGSGGPGADFGGGTTSAGGIGGGPGGAGVISTTSTSGQNAIGPGGGGSGAALDGGTGAGGNGFAGQVIIRW